MTTHLSSCCGARIDAVPMERPFCSTCNNFLTCPNCAAKDAELEQLRQAVGLLTTLKPDLVMNVTDPLAMATEIELYVHERESQLSTLKAAVRETIEIFDSDENFLQTLNQIDDLRALVAEKEK